jgi:hypothetical protein
MFGWLLVVVAFICTALMWNEGLWSNSITFVNTVFAVMIALNFYEPVATFLENRIPSFTYVVDFLSQWLLFAISLAILRVISDQVSRHAVRFKMPVEHVGRMVFALGTAWILICFTTTTMHTAPLTRSPFRGSFAEEPMSNNFFGLAPDRLLLGFMHDRSKAALSRSEPRPFDAQGEYIVKYGARRQSLQEHNALEGGFRVKK